MASTQAKAERRARALASLNRTTKRFAKVYDIDLPDVEGRANLRDPELGRVELIEQMDVLLKQILKKADPTAEAEMEVEERDAQIEAEKAEAKAQAEAEREYRKTLPDRPDLSTETDERVAEVSEAIEAGEPVPAAEPVPMTDEDIAAAAAAQADVDAETADEPTEETVAMPKGSTTTNKPGSKTTGTKLNK